MYTYQVKFKPLNKYDNGTYGGICVNDVNDINEKYVICGCCGTIFTMDEVEIISKYEDWVNLSEEIKGDE